MTKTSSSKQYLFEITFEIAWLLELRRRGLNAVRSLENAVGSIPGVDLLAAEGTGLVVRATGDARKEFLRTVEDLLENEFDEPKSDLWRHVVLYGDLNGLRKRAGDPAVPKSCIASQPNLSVTMARVHAMAKEENPKRFGSETKKREMGERTERKRSGGLGVPDEEIDFPDAGINAEEGGFSTETPQDVLADVSSSAPLKYEPTLLEYLREVATVVPRLKALGAAENFWRQHVLLSIDDGRGGTVFHKSLVRLYRALGLLESDAKMGLEVKIHEKESTKDLVEKISGLSERMARGCRTGRLAPVLFLDLSERIEILDMPDFRWWLRNINDNEIRFICVFRVPYMEEESLKRTEAELNDILNVRTVTVPPTDMDTMVDYVRDALGKKDFRFDDSAVEPVRRWIRDEMGDGCFFGYKTLDKMVSRMIYEKTLVSGDDRTVFERRTIDAGALGALHIGAVDPDGDPEEAFGKLVGLPKVKNTIDEILTQITTLEKLGKKGRKMEFPAIHMVFSGCPGTGKTTVARLVARLMKKRGVLSKGHLVEVRGRDLCGRYVGETAPKTTSLCRRAYGGVLFIDEAYSLFRGDSSSENHDYGREALDTLIAEMENHRKDFCVILAGYTEDMNTMLDGNAGLRSRIPHIVEFPNYTRDELGDIFLNMLGDTFDMEKGFVDSVRRYFSDIPDTAMNSREFSNARLVRNLFERIWSKAACRNRVETKDSESIRLLKSDLEAAVGEPEFRNFFQCKPRAAIGFGALSAPSEARF